MREDLHAQLEEAKAQLNQALDTSFEWVSQGGAKQEVAQEWSQFVGEFFTRVKQESRARKENLLNWVRLPM